MSSFSRLRKTIQRPALWCAALLLGACAHSPDPTVGGPRGGDKGSYGHREEIRIDLVDGDGPAVRQVEIGGNVELSLDGLAPRTPYDLVLEDEEGQLISWARLTSDLEGTIAPFVLWYQTGVVGCTRHTEDLEGRYWFRSHEEAREALAGRNLRFQVRSPRGERLAEAELPVAKTPSGPTLHAGNAKGCLLNSAVRRKEDLHAVGKGFPAGSIVEIFVVPDQQHWRLREPLRDLRGQRRSHDPLVVRLAPEQTDFIARIWEASELQVGSYDLVARHYLEGEDHIEWAFLEAGDLVASRASTGFVVQEVWGQDPHLSEEIAGFRVSGFPYFEHADGFAKGTDIWGALDPKKKPVTNPFTYAAWYVVDHKAVWSDGDALVDVTGGAEVTPIQPGCINGTRTLLWQNASPSGVGPASPTKAYDVVLDFGNFTPGSPVTTNGTYTMDLDFIDRAETVGFHILDDPKSLGSFPVGTVDLDAGCDFALDTTLNWTNDFFSNPVPMVLLDPNSSYEPCNNSSDPLYDPNHTARILARVKYPKAPGTSTAVAAGGPFPLVLFLHGQQGFSVEGWKGYDYLLELLASHGFVAASIAGNDLLDASMIARGELMREFLRRFRDANASGGAAISGVSFVGKVDLSRSVLVGHSRGGEAVVGAYELQRTNPDPGYGIAGLVAIAPVQAFGHWGGEPAMVPRLKDVAYLVLHGAKDGDVSSFPGMRTYDRASAFEHPGNTPRQAVLIEDAIHAFFNSKWYDMNGDPLCSCEAGIVGKLTPSQHQDAARVYIHAFVQAYVLGRAEYLSFFDGVLPPPVTPSIQVATSYHPPAADRFVIDGHEEKDQGQRSLSQNTLGGPVTATSLDLPAAGGHPGLTFGEYQLRAAVPSLQSPIASDPGFVQGGTPPPSSDATATINSSFPHSTHGVVVGWNATGDRYETEIPATCTIGGTTFADCRAEAANYTHLSLRVGQVFRASGNINPASGSQNFRVTVEDSDGDRSPPIRISSFADLPFPFVGETASGTNGPKSMMRTVRIPLAAFTFNSSQVDLNKLQKIIFLFDRTAQGEIALDDIELVK